MRFRLLVVILSVAACIAPAMRAAADTQNAVAVKVGGYFLGDDTAGGYYGGSPSVSAGAEYRLAGSGFDAPFRTSVYVDYSHGRGQAGALSLYSTGVAERVRIGRPSRGGAFPYLGVGFGTNVNVFSLPGGQGVSQTAFAQKAILGLQRGDGIFYEAYFRAAPQNAGVITSGLGVSVGYHL